MDLELVRKIQELEQRLDALAFPEIGVKVVGDNVSNPPTDGELDTAFGTVYDGFIGLVDDNAGGTAVWFCAYVNSKWWYELLTAAV